MLILPAETNHGFKIAKTQLTFENSAYHFNSIFRVFIAPIHGMTSRKRDSHNIHTYTLCFVISYFEIQWKNQNEISLQVFLH